MAEKQICPECEKEMIFAGKIEYGGLGTPNRLVNGYKCTSKNCIGNPDYDLINSGKRICKEEV